MPFPKLGKEIWFWQLIKGYRIETGLSQRLFAKLIESTQAHISRSENHGSRIPDRSMVLKVAKVFGLDPVDTEIFLAIVGYSWTQRFYEALIECVEGSDRDRYQGFTKLELICVLEESAEAIRDLDRPFPIGAPS